MSRSSINALSLAHEVIARHVRPGDFCIDATAGRGGDTAFLCSLVGEKGRVLAMDIQAEAVESTRALLREKGCDGVATVVQDSHANMAEYAELSSAACIVFNLGWLPGGNHGLFTRADTTVSAVEAGLGILKPGGLMCVCVYYGRDCGFGERDALLDYVRGIDYRRFTVVVTDFANRPNNPAFPVFITRDE